MPARQAQCSLTVHCICLVTPPLHPAYIHLMLSCSMSITQHHQWSIHCWENLWHTQNTWPSFCKHFSWLQHAVNKYLHTVASVGFFIHIIPLFSHLIFRQHMPRTSAAFKVPHIFSIFFLFQVFFDANYCGNCKFPFTLYFLCMSHMLSQYLTLHKQNRINC